MIDLSNAESANNAVNLYHPDPAYCVERLPCGYCPRLNRACPMTPQTTITFNTYGPDCAVDAAAATVDNIISAF